MSQKNLLSPYELLNEAFANNAITTNSLDQWLELFVVEAETLFGPRLFPSTIRPTKIYFEGNRPFMDFGERNDKGTFKQFLIRLSKSAQTDLPRALFQLSHESVHLLSPIPWEDTMLEEGMACWYEEHWAKKCPTAFPIWAQNATDIYSFQQKKYSEAKRLVTELLDLDKTCIRRMREIQPQIGKITAKLILQTVPKADPKSAKALVKKWSRHPNPGATKSPPKAPSLVTLKAPIAIHAFPDSQTTAQKQFDEFQVWCRDTEPRPTSLSADVKFDGTPILEVTRAANQKERTVFKHVDVSGLRGKTISFEYYSKGHSYFARRFLNIANERGQIVFSNSGFADCFHKTWLKETITFTVPDDGAILEVRFVLHRKSTLWLASPRIVETEKLTTSEIQCTSSSPSNLNFEEPISSPSPFSGWQRSFTTHVSPEDKWQFKNIHLKSRKTHKPKNSVELRARGCDEKDRCEFFQSFNANNYKQKTVQFSGVFKVENSNVRFEAFIKFSGESLVTKTLSSITAKWQPFCLIVEVPPGCENLTIGFRLLGQGQALVSSLEFETV